MADANPSRLGQINAAGDALALFLKVFSGEVLTTFDQETMYKDKHLTRTIASGKSAQFPAVGITDAFYHTPGAEILGSNIKQNEVLINIEGLLVSPVFVSSIDEAMNHYDLRSIYSHEIGQALALRYDGNVAREIINAARATVPNVQGVFAGDVLDSTLTNAGYATDGPTLFNGVYDAAVLLDQRNIPQSDRYGTFRPVQYSLLVKSEKPFDYRLNDGQTGLGGYATGRVAMIANIPILKTNALPGVDDSANADQPAQRQHDYSVTQGLIHHKTAAGTVALQDVQMESEWDMRRQGWLMLGKYLCGHGKLRPEAAVEIQSAAPAS